MGEENVCRENMQHTAFAEAGHVFLIYGKNGVAGGQVKKVMRVGVVGITTEDQVL